MTLFDNPTPPRRLSEEERALIAEFERMHGVTQCPASTFSACTLTDRQIALRASWSEYITRSNKRRARK
ncbi:hypothetical protein [Paracoccus sp. PAR01]|uniref:hypothetical protein n=1 Tax=Paracoccus sp. PAR01 TaxID=2769282 RepID=UPI0017827DF7|nr:hypothetical protein [Paracoccus sp. PAR01]MBD9528996.1 hypothetical protein [Paracoccus sp. PAR01]